MVGERAENERKVFKRDHWDTRCYAFVIYFSSSSVSLVFPPLSPLSLTKYEERARVAAFVCVCVYVLYGAINSTRKL